MKRRLRKKLRLGEWQEFGLRVTFSAAPCKEEALCMDVLDRFFDVENALSVDSWGSGTGWIPGAERQWEAYIFAVKRYSSVTEEEKAALEAWLKQEPEIVYYAVGPFIDRNHSPEWMDSGDGSRYWGRIAKRTPRT